MRSHNSRRARGRRYERLDEHHDGTSPQWYRAPSRHESNPAEDQLSQVTRTAYNNDHNYHYHHYDDYVNLRSALVDLRDTIAAIRRRKSTKPSTSHSSGTGEGTHRPSERRDREEDFHYNQEGTSFRSRDERSEPCQRTFDRGVRGIERRQLVYSDEQLPHLPQRVGSPTEHEACRQIRRAPTSSHGTTETDGYQGQHSP
ncbi:uncharacterized protein LOC117646538 [Thrips palmi]|uniref:Uncharacterized protein LOC117646538 n=1 Tax=Thrips palmi TaxID=161013 RepID=A0A6P8Z8Z7_THRPL|nr:uncharacterized protein LOC117646538 [Thrips palmi]